MLVSDAFLVQYIFHMFEQKPKEKRTPSSPEDIQDALTLAFFDTDLEDCEVDDLPLTPLDEHVWQNCKMRKKEERDWVNGSRVEITHYTYEQVEKGEVTLKETLYIEWDDENGTDLAINLRTGSIGTYERQKDGEYAYKTYEATDAIDRQKTQAKLALAAITSIV